MLLENQDIKIMWWYTNKERYVNLGYNFTKIRDYFNVKIEDLQNGSHTKVFVKCDYCENIKSVLYKDYLKRHDKELGDCCHKCEYVKAKRTNLERYGFEDSNKCIEISNKIKATNLRNNGCEYPMQNKDVLKRANDTNMIRYGVSRPLQNKEFFEKYKSTCIEKFGVEYYTLTEEYKIKSNKTYFKNGTIRTSSQQFKLCKDLENIYGKCELNYPLGKYSLDCMIEIDGILIDVEYDGWYWHQDESKDNERDEFVIKNGYKVFRIKGGTKNPTKNQLKKHISHLISTNSNLEILILESKK